MPQGSTLVPVLFNAFINNRFLLVQRANICNFADDSSIYRWDSDLEIILEDLQHDTKILSNWFKINSMKPNRKYFQLKIVGKGPRLSVILNINNIISNSITKTSVLFDVCVFG